MSNDIIKKGGIIYTSLIPEGAQYMEAPRWGSP